MMKYSPVTHFPAPRPSVSVPLVLKPLCWDTEKFALGACVYSVLKWEIPKGLYSRLYLCPLPKMDEILGQLDDLQTY